MAIESLLFFFNYAELKLNRVEHQKFQVQGAQPVAAANAPTGGRNQKFLKKYRASRPETRAVRQPIVPILNTGRSRFLTGVGCSSMYVVLVVTTFLTLFFFK
jgi:hypothetical protein